MITKKSAVQMLDREFLEVRTRLIDIAAALDRIDRAGEAGAVHSDPGMTQLARAAAILFDGRPHRAERVQWAFSDDFDPDWRRP